MKLNVKQQKRLRLAGIVADILTVKAEIAIARGELRTHVLCPRREAKVLANSLMNAGYEVYIDYENTTQVSLTLMLD